MEAVRLADRIAIMKDGQVVQVGTPEEIVLNPATEYVSEFVKEVPRTRIIKVGQLMEPLTDTSSARIAQATQHEGLDASMTLDDALAWSALRGQSLPVNDANGQAIGTITPETLAAVINGDGTKKPAQGSSPDA
jgi:glycine betaine/proline transport system ATP-binding protein